MRKQKCVVCLERPEKLGRHGICEECHRSITSRGFEIGLVEWAARRARAYQKRRDRKGREGKKHGKKRKKKKKQKKARAA